MQYETQGYTIIKIRPPCRVSELVADGAVGRFVPICNGLGCEVVATCDEHDRGRVQADLNDRGLQRQLLDVLVDVLKRHKLLGQQKPYGVKAVKCLPGTWNQGLHADWPAGAAHADAAQLPFTVLWAVNDEFQLNIVPREQVDVAQHRVSNGQSVRLMAQSVEVQRHKAIVFQGCVVHGGGAHVNSAWRLFVRFASPSSAHPQDVHMLTSSYAPGDAMGVYI